MWCRDHGSSLPQTDNTSGASRQNGACARRSRPTRVSAQQKRRSSVRPLPRCALLPCCSGADWSGGSAGSSDAAAGDPILSCWHDSARQIYSEPASCSPMPSESGRAIVLMILLLCQAQTPVGPRSPSGILLWARNSPRSQGRDDSIIAHSVTTRAPDRGAGASRSLPSKDTGRGASPPWP
jgi:hypothetical protein